ncbi:hypothetical protein DRN74_05535, partial [Candidatus Micrarchaeota archaeon]
MNDDIPPTYRLVGSQLLWTMEAAPFLAGSSRTRIRRSAPEQGGVGNHSPDELGVRRRPTQKGSTGVLAVSEDREPQARRKPASKYLYQLPRQLGAFGVLRTLAVLWRTVKPPEDRHRKAPGLFPRNGYPNGQDHPTMPEG